MGLSPLRFDKEKSRSGPRGAGLTLRAHTTNTRQERPVPRGWGDTTTLRNCPARSTDLPGAPLPRSAGWRPLLSQGPLVSRALVSPPPRRGLAPAAPQHAIPAGAYLLPSTWHQLNPVPGVPTNRSCGAPGRGHRRSPQPRPAAIPAATSLGSRRPHSLARGRNRRDGERARAGRGHLLSPQTRPAPDSWPWLRSRPARRRPPYLVQIHVGPRTLGKHLVHRRLHLHLQLRRPRPTSGLLTPSSGASPALASLDSRGRPTLWFPPPTIWQV